MRSRPAIRLSAAVIAASLLVVGCSSEGAEPTAAEEIGIDDAFGDDDEFTEDEFAEEEFAEDEFDAGGEAGGTDEFEGTAPVDLSLVRDDVDCSEEGLGADDATSFITAHYVVNGTLGAVCYGDADPTLTEAWEILAVITPRLQLADLGVFASFESGEDGEEVTLAFVNALDADGTLFQMSINSATYEEDPNEAMLTMAHEFSHVFTALPSQLDRTVEASDDCDTYDNGEGCYLPDSLMAQWVELFWGDGLIDEVDPNAEATGSEGQDRCDANPGFLGAYAASNPEEDFAESFSAYVFQLDPGTDEVRAKLDWIDGQPGLAEFRSRALAAGLGPLDNNFDLCGDF